MDFAVGGGRHAEERQRRECSSSLPPRLDRAGRAEAASGKGIPSPLRGSPYPVVVGAVDIAGHAEVPDLHHQAVAVADQAVAGGQVPVDKVQGGQVHHPGGHLRGDLQHLAEGQLPAGLAAPMALQDLGIWPVGPAGREGLAWVSTRGNKALFF